VTVAHDAVDASGRHGIAVARTFNGIKIEHTGRSTQRCNSTNPACIGSHPQRHR
jgi:hypothetical protein